MGNVVISQILPNEECWIESKLLSYYSHIFKADLFGYFVRQLPYIIVYLEPLRTELPARKSKLG